MQGWDQQQSGESGCLPGAFVWPRRWLEPCWVTPSPCLTGRRSRLHCLHVGLAKGQQSGFLRAMRKCGSLHLHPDVYQDGKRKLSIERNIYIYFLDFVLYYYQILYHILSICSSICHSINLTFSIRLSIYSCLESNHSSFAYRLPSIHPRIHPSNVCLRSVSLSIHLFPHPLFVQHPSIQPILQHLILAGSKMKVWPV